MLRSDGTLALGVAPPVGVLPPHAARKTPAANRAGPNRASFMRTYLSDATSHCLLPGFLSLGARVRRQRVLLRPYEPDGILLPSRTGVKLAESQNPCSACGPI